jgi:hypothetical protein
MSIYGIGAYYENDVSKDFILNRVVGCGWSSDDAPEIHQFILYILNRSRQVVTI